MRCRRRTICRACACAHAARRRSREVAQTLFKRHRQRTLVGLSLMAAQAFFYNAIFFTYALILTDFYGVPPTMSAGTSCRSPPAIFSARCCSAACSTRMGRRADDRLHLRHLRRAARRRPAICSRAI